MWLIVMVVPNNDKCGQNRIEKNAIHSTGILALKTLSVVKRRFGFTKFFFTLLLLLLLVWNIRRLFKM